MTRVIFPGGDADDVLAALEALTRDIGRIRAGAAPSPTDLKGAPVLQDWSPAIRQTVCMVGTVLAHPLIGDGRPITTSEVYAIDPLRGWARTYSRFYLLGAKFGEREVGHA